MRCLSALLLLLAACGDPNADCTLGKLTALCAACQGTSQCGQDPLCENGEWSIDCRETDLSVATDMSSIVDLAEDDGQLTDR